MLRALILAALAWGFLQDPLPDKVEKLVKDWERHDAAADLEGGLSKKPALNPFVVSAVAKSDSDWSLQLGGGEFRIEVERAKVVLRQGGASVQSKLRKFDRSAPRRVTAQITTDGLKVYLDGDYLFGATFVKEMEGPVGASGGRGFELQSLTLWMGPRPARPEPSTPPLKPEGAGAADDLGPLGRWIAPAAGARTVAPPCGCDKPPVGSPASLEKSVGLDVTVAIRPDAPPEFYEPLQRRFQQGSERLFELTEGQMYIRAMLIRDKEQTAQIVITRLDGQFLEDGKPVAGQVQFSGRTGIMLLPGEFHPYTFVHEAGHLWLGLPDEYGDKPGCDCVMSAGRSMKPKFCDGGGAHTGEGDSCWDRILRRYSNWKHPNPVSGTAPTIQFKVEDR
jgi:hypothetical protein